MSMEVYKQKALELKNLREEMQATLSNSLETELLRILNDGPPGLLSVSWNQYTPYWNDGDTCEFSANTDYVTIETDKELGTEFTALASCDDEEELKTSWRLSGVSINSLGIYWDKKSKAYKNDPAFPPTLTPLRDTLQQIYHLLDCMEDDGLRDAFGDHAQVTIRRTGITTKEFEHE
jgi:hypothetical protein